MGELNYSKSFDLKTNDLKINKNILNYIKISQLCVLNDFDFVTAALNIGRIQFKGL